MAPVVEVKKSSADHPMVDWAVAMTTLEGETSSGDGHLVKVGPDRILVAAVDGLGHGEPAAAATKIAIDTLEKSPNQSIISLVQDCHRELRNTRGVVMSLASFDVNENTMAWMGVGNVEGILLRADPNNRPATENVIQRGGVVGYQLPQLSGNVLPVAPGDTLIFSTDGILYEYTSGVIRADPPERIAERICTRHNKRSDDALVLVVRYRGRGA